MSVLIKSRKREHEVAWGYEQKQPMQCFSFDNSRSVKRCKTESDIAENIAEVVSNKIQTNLNAVVAEMNTRLRWGYLCHHLSLLPCCASAFWRNASADRFMMMFSSFWIKRRRSLWNTSPGTHILVRAWALTVTSTRSRAQL